RIWLALPLLALWSNLHGTALAGLAMLYLYLALELSRRRPLTAAGLALTAPLAMCLTPAGVRTPAYYWGLSTNLAAQRGAGMWAPLGTSTLDLLLIAVALLLALQIVRGERPPLWEIAAALLLAALTVKAARNGVWLLFVLAVPAARGGRGSRDWAGLIPVAAVAGLLVLALDISHWAQTSRATPPAIGAAIALAHGSPILAETAQAEQIALAGGRIWAGNPIDAFPRGVQATYLDFLAGSAGGRAALAQPGVKVVVVGAGDAAALLVSSDPAFRRVALDGNTAVYERRE
ncbi:MAG TPA: hypothetical protein VME01_04300, partial [Solirubrobacteraceae bacterium]|nr:hypothetical protein [Solirubrobacteraceae bacterium]